MKLDLDKIARVRRKNPVNYRPMAYLSDRINAELEDRIQLQGASCKRWLSLDFINSPLLLPGNQHTKLSLIERDTTNDLANLADSELDAAVINLQLAWLDYESVFELVHKTLGPGGRLFFCTLGPDTLIELHEAWSGVDQCPHVHSFTDLHHLGDRLVKTGFQNPILDADWVGVEYQDIDLLMEDLRHEGFHNVLSQRRKTLTGKSRLDRLRNDFNSRPGPVQMTFEFIYGYAEKAPQRAEGIKVDLPRQF